MTVGSWTLEQHVTGDCLLNSEKRLEVTLGDGYNLDAIGRGVVLLETKLHSSKTKKCKLHDVLYVPKLSYNLLSVSKVSDAGKTARFGETSCQILYDRKLCAVVTMVGDLYYLNCRPKFQKAYKVRDKRPETKEDVWH